jgi:hypothetical protein
MANLLRTEQVPGQDREIRYYDDGTSVAVNMPQGYYTNQSSGVIPSPTVSEDRISSSNPTSPTIGQIVGQYETPEEQAYRQQYGQNLLTESQTTPDLNKIRQDTLARYQAEIDAINSSYATKKAAERIQGQGRLGSAGAIQARRGLLGSDFGAAQTDTINQYNAELIDAIEQERLAKVSSIMSEANRFAQEEYDKKLEAKRLGAENYLKFIGESATRRQNNTAKMAAYLYQQGNYDTLTPAELKQIADNLGVSVDTLKAVYADYAGQAQAAQAKAQAAQAKAQAEAEKEALGMEKTRAEISNLKGQSEKDMIAKGYTYVATPAQRDALKKQGYSITTLNGRTYAKPPQTKTIQIGKSDYLITFDEAGNIIGKTLLGSSGTGTGSKTSSGSTFNKKLAQSKIEQFFYQQSGNSKKVSPDDYYLAKQAWVEDGGKEEDFDTIFYKRLYTHPALNR